MRAERVAEEVERSSRTFLNEDFASLIVNPSWPFPDQAQPLNHSTRHKTANGGTSVLIVGPNNAPPEAVGHFHDGNVWNVDPLVIKKDLKMSVLASPIRVPQSVAVGKRTADLSSFGFQLFEPFAHIRIGLRVFSFWIARNR